MSTESLIHGLSADLAPVRRRRASREVGLVLGLGAAELALVFASGFTRPDLGSVMAQPFTWWKLGSLALIAAASTVLAIRSFVPGFASRRGTAAVVGVAVLAAVSGVLSGVGSRMGATLVERLFPLHGLVCALAIIALSLPMAGLLTVLMRRAAPTDPVASALAAGIAAGGWGALIFAFCCPMNDPLYVAVWYAAACAVVTTGARLTFPLGYRL